MSPTASRPSVSGTDQDTDDLLLDRVRAGEVDAYGELWRRHVRVALSVAGRYSTVADPEDIVQEAFQAVFTAVCDGGGPVRGFRPYLTRTVRNVAVSISRRRRAEPVGGLTELADRVDVSVAGHDEHSTERLVLARAFQSLPDRWRAILWMTEVEDLPVQDAAERLGIAPNAGAALGRRAREGLRRAWLAAHLSARQPGRECLWVVEHLPLAERGDVSESRRRRIDEHTESCDDCALAALEIAAVARRLPAVLVPIVLTGGAAADRLLAGVPATPLDATPAAARATAWASLWGPVAAVVAVVVVVVGLVLGTRTLPGPAGAVTAVTGAPASSPTAAATVPAVPLSPVTTSPAGGADLGAAPASPSLSSGGPLAPAVDDGRPSEPDGVGARPGLLAPGVPSVTAGVPFAVTGAPASGLREWLPVISGTAETGTTVEAVLGDGVVVGTTRAVDGTWSLTLDRDLVVDVEHEVFVRSAEHGGLVRAGSYTFVAPLVRGVEVVETAPGVHDAVVLVTGTCDQSVEAVVDGAAESTSVVLGACTTRVPLTGLQSGTHTVAIRYVDEAAGLTGAVRTVTVTV